MPIEGFTLATKPLTQKPTCLECGKPFIRNHPDQKFCGKDKRGRHACKDRYHNRKQFRAAVSAGDDHKLGYFGTSMDQRDPDVFDGSLFGTEDGAPPEVEFGDDD